MKLPTEEFRKIMEEEKERRKKDIEVEKERKKVEKEREKAENKARREEEKAVKKIERDRVINWNGLEVNNYFVGYVFLQILRLEVDKVTFVVFFIAILLIISQERERHKEEKRLEAIRLKEWNKPREDLELDDFKVCFTCNFHLFLIILLLKNGTNVSIREFLLLFVSTVQWFNYLVNLSILLGQSTLLSC